MVPSHELRLRSMLRALTEVILPAVDKADPRAMDQAQILAGNLRILLTQHDKSYHYALTELREYAALVDDLLAVTGSDAGAEDALATARPITALNVPSEAALGAHVAALKIAADTLTARALDGSADQRDAAARLILAQGRKQVLRERVWVADSGFEADAASLPKIETLLD